MTQLDGAAQVASMDQATAQMADLGRGWATLYRAMVDSGMPERLARRLVNRQHMTACRTQLLSAEWAVRRGAG